MTPFIIGLLLVSALITIVALAIVLTTRRGKSCTSQEKYQQRWLAIQQAIKRDNPESYLMAIINADALLDSALKERCFDGKTCGERIRSAKDTLSSASTVWSAHKLRNQIVHEHNASLKYDEARRALAGYKQGLKDIGAI
ncbi:MAG TPA: hypothetical protein PKD19_00895 [Candidatus Saccharibacteria bacterium]|mgnify:CR=1 FL=1|jgi:hypothetical protein|nr:hypothetical protein [Candidatus Saccharibacteria bacterium]HMR38211.1 hypothetical protein [Candidatus Saccharibacteria bacterium]